MGGKADQFAGFLFVIRYSDFACRAVAAYSAEAAAKAGLAEAGHL